MRQWIVRVFVRVNYSFTATSRLCRFTDEKITQIKFNKPPQEIHGDFRPISFTNSVAKILEGFTNWRLLHQVGEYIDPKQFARKGQSTTHALVYRFQAIHVAIDRGISCVRIFFSDFSKGFDIIDHHILTEELSFLGVDPVLERF